MSDIFDILHDKAHGPPERIRFDGFAHENQKQSAVIELMMREQGDKQALRIVAAMLMAMDEETIGMADLADDSVALAREYLTAIDAALAREGK